MATTGCTCLLSISAKYVIVAVKLAIKNKMATNIVCYYNFAHKQGILMVLPVVRIGKNRQN